MILRFILLFTLSLWIFPLWSQHKKKIDWYELDLHHGKLFQPNTIKPYTGTAFENYADDSKKKRVPIKEGKVHGKVEEWAMNGEKVSELNYENGVPNGVEKQWYESGKPKLEAQYINGVVKGKVIEWYETGKLKSEGVFENGKEEGLHQWYFSNGQKDQAVYYQNGKANGKVQHWHFNGQLKLKGNFKNGLEEGYFKEWHPNGNLEVEGRYVQGIKQDTFKIYAKNGQIQEINIYDQGDLKKAYNYRSGNIHWNKGYTQVFNGKNSFYTIDILDRNVYPRRSTREIIYVVDKYLLQLINTPISTFNATKADSPQQILEKYVSFEADYIASNTKQRIDIKKESGKTQKGIPYIHWSFKPQLPSETVQTARTVVEEHYFSLWVGDEILSLSSLVTKVNDPKAVQKMLLKVAETLRIHDERIELNALNKSLHQK